MNRRDAVSRIAIIMGSTMIGAEFILSGCSPSAKKVDDLFSDDNIALLDEVGETIIPATDTPGAKDVHTGSFMAMMVRDCYEDADQKVFVEGINKLQAACKAKYKQSFTDCTSARRTEFLNGLDAEQHAYTKSKKASQPNHYFRMMKELTLLSYFTSEAGCTKALRYVPVPGRYDGNYPYKPGDKAWALS